MGTGLTYLIIAGLLVVAYFFVKRMRDWGIDNRTKAISDKYARQVAPRELERANERTAQLDRLRASLPNTPPQKMRAAFQVSRIRIPVYSQKTVRHPLNEPTFIRVETDEVTEYAVDMVLQMTERERAIVRKHELDDVILEDVPAFSKADLARIASEYDEEVDAAKDPYLKEARRQSSRMALEGLREERSKTRIGDLLVSPFCRSFDTRQEAEEYLEKLKTKYLPRVRELIDRYSDYKPTQIQEF